MESIDLGTKFDWNEGWESDVSQIKCISGREREFTNACFKEFISHFNNDGGDAFEPAMKMFCFDEEPSNEELVKLRKKFLRQVNDFKQAFDKTRINKSDFVDFLGKPCFYF